MPFFVLIVLTVMFGFVFRGWLVGFPDAFENPSVDYQLVQESSPFLMFVVFVCVLY